MVAHQDDFCRGVAMVLQGESLKASCYVPHGSSLGTLREKMVSSFIRHETPDKFRVETGLVRNHETGTTSRQCDLLIHEPGVAAPLYRWEEYVVVHDYAARAVVEVKSSLFREDFGHLLKVRESIFELEVVASGQLFIPTFGYGLTGASFASCIEYVQDAVAANQLNRADGQRHLNWPACFAIQDNTASGSALWGA